MSGVLIALVAFAAVAVFVLVLLALGLASSAAHSDRVERRAILDWARRRHRRRKAA
jgi:hypothetical protein